MLEYFAQAATEADVSESLTLGFVVGGALADSINPCVFGVLIFLLAFMTRVYKQRKQMLIAGLWYTFVVYATYLAIGFGVLKIAVSFEVANTFYWIGAVLAIGAGLLELKDYFWYGKGFSLQMVPGAAKRVKNYTTWVERLYKNKPKLSFLLIGLLGIFVVIVELPCTGAPYFAVLALLADGDYGTAVPYLLLYNLIFVLPLFFIIGLAYAGKGDGLEGWRKKHRAAMRLGTGIFLLALGGYMLYSVTGS